MRYLRMLSNSVIAGGVASGYLTALVLQLNPAVSIDPGTLLPLALVLGVAYGANLTVLFYALIVLRQILAVEVLSPGWLSVRLLSWLCTIAAGTRRRADVAEPAKLWRRARSDHASPHEHRRRHHIRRRCGVPGDCARAPGPARRAAERRPAVGHDHAVGGLADCRPGSGAAVRSSGTADHRGRGARSLASTGQRHHAHVRWRHPRHDLAGRGCRTPAEHWPHFRPRRGPAPGDAEADTSRTRVERDCHRAPAHVQRRALGRGVSRVWRTPNPAVARLLFCPGTRQFRLPGGRTADHRRPHRAADLEHPQRPRRSRRRDWLASHATGAAGRMVSWSAKHSTGCRRPR